MSITHIEDLPLPEFIKAVKNIGDMHASEKLDGANLWMGLDTSGKFFTSREGKRKGSAAFHTEADYPHFAAYNGFRSAHAALEAKIDDIKRIMQPGQSVEMEILFGRQPNAVTYGAENKSYIAFLRGVSGTPDVIADQLSTSLGGSTVTVNVEIIDTTDGENLDSQTQAITYQFTGAQKIDAEKLKDVNLDKHLSELETFLAEPAGIDGSDATNMDLIVNSLGSFKTDIRPQAKDKKAAVLGKIMTDFKLPIKKELLDNYVSKIKPALGDPEVTADEDVGIEGIVLRDPTTGNMIKLVDKDNFTTINSFNHAIRNQISGVTKTLDGTAPLEARGGIVGNMKIQIADLLGNKELARGSTAKRAFELVKGGDPVETVKNFSKNLSIDDFLGMKRKLLAIIAEAHRELKVLLEDFKASKDEFQLKLKNGKIIGISPEIEKRTLLVFAESNRNVLELFDKIKKAGSVAQCVAVLYGHLARAVHIDPAAEEPITEEKAKYDPTKNKPLGSAKDADGYRIEIHSHVVAPLNMHAYNDLGYPIVRSGTMYIFNPQNKYVQAGYWMNWPEPEWKLSMHQWLKMTLKKRAQMEAEWQTHAYDSLEDQFKDRSHVKEDVLLEKKYTTDKARYANKDADTIMNIYMATLLMSVVMYQADDKRGILLLKDKTHYRMNSWDKDMSPLNFWGYPVWRSSQPAVKKLIGPKAATTIYKISRLATPSQSRYLHMDLSFGKDVPIEWSDHRKTVEILLHYDGLHNDRINNLVDGVFSYETLSHDKRVKTLSKLFYYVQQFIPSSPLFPRLKSIQDELLLNANGVNDQMVEGKLFASVNALAEEEAGPDDAGTPQPGAQIDIATRAADANPSKDAGNSFKKGRMIIKRKRNPEVKKPKFPRPDPEEDKE